VAELKVLVLLLIPALNPPRVDEAVIPKATVAAIEATSSLVCPPIRRNMVFPVVLRSITAALRSITHRLPIDTRRGPAGG
jgi:hypothetical protein